MSSIHRARALADRYLPAWVWQFFKFGTKGGLGLLFNILLLTIIVDFIGIRPEWAVFVAWAATLIPGYVLTDKFVFSGFKSPDTVGRHGQRGLLHYAVMWIGKGTNYLIYYALLAVPGMWYQAAWFIGAVAVLPWNFGMNYWLWKKNVSGFGEVYARLRGLVSRSYGPE